MPILPQRAIRTELFRFGSVGVLGFFVNVATTYVMSGVANLYLAGLAGFLTAATSTWYVNRHWTFSDRSRSPWFQQLKRFLLANAFGFLVYYSVYASLITVSPRIAASPIVAVAIGSLAGLGVNFTLSRLFVFGRRPGS